MEIRQLEALTAVVASGSVTAAGRLLDRSQPVVSRQISDLEMELGFVLFTRTRPTITLTPQGLEFYQEARSVLADLQQLQARAQDIANGTAHPLRILATPDLVYGVLPHALARIDRFNPVFQQRLIVEEICHDAVESALIEGHADICLVNLPIDHEQCQIHWCGQAPCLLALPETHTLVGHDIIRLEDLQDSPIITLLGRYRLRYHLATALVKATSHHTRRHIETSSHQAALSMVRAGLGVALIDPFTIRAALLDQVVIRPIDVDVPYMIGVVSQRNRTPSEDAVRLIQGLRSYVLARIPHFVETNPSGLPIRPGRANQSHARQM
ncbi:LysR family transcriptional regulator [Alcaligenaceae bacterium CGII-47]|nr:LysR family transcriptional regulator [Alcaligenaceae bacterium CGII-47]